LRHENVAIAVTVEISGEQRSRFHQSDGSQTRGFRHIGEAFASHISQQPDFAVSIGFANGGKIEQSVVVHIHGSDSPAAVPCEIGYRHPFEAGAAKILPDTQSGFSPVSEGKVHPSVLVEIESDDAGSGRRKRRLPGFGLPEWPFAWIGEKRRGSAPRGQQKVDRTIVVKVGSEGGNTGSISRQARLSGPFCKGSIAVVAP